MKRAIILLFVLLNVIAIIAKGHYFRHLGVSDGLSQVNIPSIYQDELGAIWLGTSEGLNRYNGKEIRVFRPSHGDEGLTNNEINQLCGDKKGRMYILSGHDLIKLDIYKEQFTCLRKDDVRGMFCEGDTLWVTCKDGIYYYTAGATDLVLYTRLIEGVGRGLALLVDKETIWVITGSRLLAISRHNPTRQEVLTTFHRGNCIFGDSSGHIWVGAWDGLYRVSRDRSVTHFTDHSGGGDLSDNQVRCVLEDNSKCIWIGTYRGLDCYDPATNEWNQYTRYGSSSNTLSHNSILSLHKDTQGNIWIGTYYGGVNVFNPNRVNNHFYYAEPLLDDCLSFPVVGKMAEDSKGNMWICTDGGGLNCYHTATGKFTRYTQQANDLGAIGSNNLKSIYYRKENNHLYVGTHLGGLFVLDLHSNKGRSFHHIKSDPTSLPHEVVSNIQEYKNGLALLTQGGPVYMDLQTEKFSPLTNDPEILQLVNREYGYETFLIDSRQRMWMAIATGGILCVDLPTSKVTRYMCDSNHTAEIGKFKVVHIFEDSKQNVYFCTIGSGVFQYPAGGHTFKTYNASNHSLPSDYCYYICESEKPGSMYLLHGKGLSVFDPDKGAVESTFHLFQQSYSQWSSLYKNSQGTIFISGTNGLALVQEHLLYNSPVRSHLRFDKLFILNNEIHPNDESGILTNILAKTSDIRLGADQNNVGIEFATFNYRNDHNNVYEYRLEGFDNVWTQTSGTTITYTNLPSGDYKLMVRRLGDKEYASGEISLNIHVAAPFYATMWAYLFYVLCLAGLLAAFIRFKMRQAALRASLKFERKEKERIEEMNQIKLRFFTNISHEFRTPLTLILGQIEVLMQMDKLGTAVYNRMLRVYKNAWHMRNLISELLDFRKQEQGYLKLKVEEQDLVAFTRQIYMCFYEHAQKKGINYRFDNVEETVSTWFDPVQLQKVIFNLLSNAFKYTPDKGSIAVEVRKVGSQAVVSVSDTGVGISEKDISKVFERFYQTDSATSGFRLGTGIGLALAKGIVDMHHGKIDVKSTVGAGTKFILSLPLGNRHFSDEEMADIEGRETMIIEDAVPIPFYEQGLLEKEDAESMQEESETGEDDKPVVLLVDDNEEMLQILSDIFQEVYEVHLAHNGREGLEMAQQLQPDLIVSDVVMPEMSGKDMCYKIKTNVELSHISVVLLTAQTSAEYMVEGLMFGADDYVTKPFNVKVLITRCNNLIKNKRRLMAHYADKPIMETSEISVVNGRDKELLERCIVIIRANFENQNFDVMSLATELCMGRSKLYAQFKQMTGLTPNEFILRVKLDEAMLLLKTNPELNVTEISIRLGFSSPRYFSKSFKAFFGVSPQVVRTKKM